MAAPFNPDMRRGIDRYGRVRGQGQQSGSSIFLDNPRRPRGDDEQAPLPPVAPEDVARERMRLAAALITGRQFAGLQPTVDRTQRTIDAALSMPRVFNNGMPRVTPQGLGYGGTVEDVAANTAAQTLIGRGFGRPGPRLRERRESEEAPAPVMRGNDPNAQYAERFAGDPSMFSGFDFQRDQNPYKSAKDMFARAAALSGVTADTFAGDNGKERAEQWFRQNVAPLMEEMGYEVLDVKGDQAYIRSWDGEGWVDFIQNAGGAPGTVRFAWQPQTAQTRNVSTAPLATLPMMDSGVSSFDQLLAQGVDQGNVNINEIIRQLLMEADAEDELARLFPGGF